MIAKLRMQSQLQNNNINRYSIVIFFSFCHQKIGYRIFTILNGYIVVRDKNRLEEGGGGTNIICQFSLARI